MTVRKGWVTRFRVIHPDMEWGYCDVNARSLEEAMRKAARIKWVDEQNLWRSARVILPDWDGAVFRGMDGRTLNVWCT